MTAHAAELQAGQQWTYETRPIDEGSTLVIGAIEIHTEIGTIVHITVKNVRVQNPNARDGEASHISHIPISEDSLRSSIVNLINSDSLSDGIQEGIDTWRDANGGVFEISVADAIQYIEEVLVGGDIVSE